MCNYIDKGSWRYKNGGFKIKCSAEGCNNNARIKGLCRYHYNKLRKEMKEDAEVKVEANIQSC